MNLGIRRPAVFTNPYVFPQNGIIDSFGRANENPIAAPWSGPFLATEKLRLLSNQLTISNAISGSNGSGYLTTTYGPDVEAYYTMPGFTISVLSYIFLRGAQPGSSTADGYAGVMDHSQPWFAISRIDNGVVTQLGASVVSSEAAGDAIGASVVGSTLKFYWKPSAGLWTTMLTRTDSTYSAAGYIGTYFNNNNGLADDFGGGTVV